MRDESHIPDEIRRVRLEVMGDREAGVVNLSRLGREQARLVRQLARIARQKAQITNFQSALARSRAKEAQQARPAPRYFSRAFRDAE